MLAEPTNPIWVSVAISTPWHRRSSIPAWLVKNRYFHQQCLWKTAQIRR